MEDSFKSDVFGVEKENGKVEGILAAVYQSVFGGDVYLSLEEKVANLLFNELVTRKLFNGECMKKRITLIVFSVLIIVALYVL